MWQEAQRNMRGRGQRKNEQRRVGRTRKEIEKQHGSEKEVEHEARRK